MMNVELTYQETKLIKRLVMTQIACLMTILVEDTEQDITMFVITNELDKKELFAQINADIEMYEDIYDRPELVFSMEEEDLAIIKTLLTNKTNIKWKEARQSIWRKFNLLDKINKNFSLN